MRQAWHIFKKDLRALRAEVALLATVAAVIGWAETRLSDSTWVELIGALVANYAVARVIHLEAIPGDNQFWITRPYRWKSLLAAKVIFILLCVQLPMLCAQILMILAGQFPLAASLPGLLCSQILVLLCIVLPAACLASLTAGMVPFLFSELILVAIGFIGAELLRVAPFSLPAMQPGADAMAWVRDSLAATVIVAFASLVLFRQYSNRQTNANRICGAAGLAAAAIAFLVMPWSLALAVQSQLSKQSFDGAALTASLETIKQTVFPIRGHGETSLSEVDLPISVHGIPSGMEAEADALVVTLSAPDGRTSSYDFATVFVRPGEPGAALVNMSIAVDPQFFRDESTHPVTAHATLYLTLFGKPSTVKIPIRQEPLNLIDGLQCAEGVFIQFNCRSIFRWPGRRVYAAMKSLSGGSSVKTISYSPFPAELGFGSIEQHSFSVPYAASEVAITTTEPLTHFHAELTIPNVFLSRFTKEAKHAFDNGMTGTE